MFPSGETVGLAKWIINDVLHYQSTRPVVIIIFAHVHPSVRPSPLFKISQD